MKVKEGFVVREISGEVLLVPTGALVDSFGMMTLSKSGEFVFNLLKDDISEEEIIDKVIERYGISEELAKTDVENFLNDLRERGMLEE